MDSVPQVMNPETGQLEDMPLHLRPQVVNDTSFTTPFRVTTPMENGNITDLETERRKRKLDRSQLLEAIKPQFKELFVERWDAYVMTRSMTAAQSDMYSMQQNTVVRLKRDGTAEYDAKMNMLRATIVCDHTFWLDGSKVFDQPTDPIMLAEGDNALVSLLFGAIDEQSSTTREQLEAAKNGSAKKKIMN